MSQFPIDPDERIDYEFDWATERLDVGETITSYTLTATTGVTLDGDSEADGKVTVWLKDADKTVDRWPKVTCHVVTSDGREMDDTITLRVRNA